MVIPPIFERIRESARQKKVQVQKAVNNRIGRRRRNRNRSRSASSGGNNVRNRSRENVTVLIDHNNGGAAGNNTHRNNITPSTSRPSSSIFTSADDRSVITSVSRSSYCTADDSSADESASCRKIDHQSRASTATLTADVERVVFLQYQGETKRALLPPIDPPTGENYRRGGGGGGAAVKSLDEVRELFAKAFSDHYELTLQYLRSPNVKIYIQDPMKMDFFYELDDLSDIKDRSVLKVREYSSPTSPTAAANQTTAAASALDTEIQLLTSGGLVEVDDHRRYRQQQQQQQQQQNRHKSVEDMNYFSEPEFEGAAGAEGKYRLQKSLSTSNYNYGGGGRGGGVYGGTLDRYSNYKMGIGSSYPSSPNYHHGAGVLPPKPGRYFSSGAPSAGGRSSSLRNGYSPPRSADPYSSEQEDSFGRAAAISGYREYAASPSTDSASVDALYQQRRGGRVSRSGSATPVIDEESRVRMINMEKQLASLSALVHSALMSKGVSENVYKDMEMLRREIFGSGGGGGGPPSSSSASGGGTSRDDASDTGSLSRFSDLSSEKGSERDGGTSSAPFSPPPVITANNSVGQTAVRTAPVQPSTIHLTPEARHNLRNAKRKVNEVQGDLKNLRRLAQLNAQCGRDIIRDAFERIKFLLNTNKHLHLFAAQAQQQNMADANNQSISGDRKLISHEEDRYLMETKRVEKGLSYLEKDVEELRQKVISGDRRLRMSEVEQFTDNLTQIGRTAANLKNNFSSLENRLRNYMTSEMEKVVREEKFLKDEPSRLDNALKRCKKLANTMVTMKKLALVQDPTAYNNGSGMTSSSSSRRPPLPSKTSSLGDAEVKSGAPIHTVDHQRHPLSPLKERSMTIDHHFLNGGSNSSSNVIRSAPGFPSTHLGPHSYHNDPTHPLDNLLEELQSAAKHKNGGSHPSSPLHHNTTGDSDTIKRSPKISNESSSSSMIGANSCVLRTNLSVNIPNRGGGGGGGVSPERRSMSPSPLATSFRAAVPFLHGGRLGAPLGQQGLVGQQQPFRSGTPTSVASEPSVYSSYRRTSDHSLPPFGGSRVPPPPPRSSSRNAVGGGPDSSTALPPSTATNTPSILSFRAEFEKKQRFFAGSTTDNHHHHQQQPTAAAGRETPIAIVQTNAVDDETKSYVRSASSSESVNSQEAPGAGGKRTTFTTAAMTIEQPPTMIMAEARANNASDKQNRYVKFQLPDDGHR